MTIETYDVSRPQLHNGFAANAWRALSSAAKAWREHRRRKAQMEELMSMDPEILSDIGVKLTPTGSALSSLLELTPVVVATRCLGGSDKR